jgi:hypothetical protein
MACHREGDEQSDVRRVNYASSIALILFDQQLLKSATIAIKGIKIHHMIDTRDGCLVGMLPDDPLPAAG